MKSDYMTVGWFNFVVAGKDLPDDERRLQCASQRGAIAHRHEAHRIGEVRGPQVDEIRAEITVGRLVDPDREDQKCDRDGEDAVAERLDASGFHRPKLH